jgi:hypothetical protein
MSPTPLDSAAHIVQLALTPVFLLSGVAALLNVFATRLGRISDQVDKLVADPGDQAPEVRAKLHYLQIRSHLLDLAVVLAASAGACTCGAALVLFLGAVRDASAGNFLFLLFGGAIALTTCALTAFVLEVLLAGIGIRRLATRRVGAMKHAGKRTGAPHLLDQP